MTAILSPCGTYRYRLSRHVPILDPLGARALFVMLNPSTADAMVDDPTIRRCLGFVRYWRIARLDVVNLYGLRATDPSELERHVDPIGPENDRHIREAMIETARESGPIVVAWGAMAPARARRVIEIADSLGTSLACLATTKEGQPRHPLYLPRSADLARWPSIASSRMESQG